MMDGHFNGEDGSGERAQPELHQRLVSVLGEKTCREVGEATGLHPESVRRYLRGRAPSAEFLVALCSAMKLNGHWLLTGEGPSHAVDIVPAAIESADPGTLLRALASVVDRLLMARMPAPKVVGGESGAPPCTKLVDIVTPDHDII